MSGYSFVSGTRELWDGSTARRKETKRGGPEFKGVSSQLGASQIEMLIWHLDDRNGKQALEILTLIDEVT